ncbi:MAG: hypothetical protein ACI8ZN_000958 [Bacteroidia bacterium]|jgi:hypothetical protein
MFVSSGHFGGCLFFIDPLGNLLLNFNYTDVLDGYFKIAGNHEQLSKMISGITRPVQIINIQGRINDEKQPIIFGFGD